MTDVCCEDCGAICYRTLRDVYGDDVIRQDQLETVHKDLAPASEAITGSLVPRCPDCGGAIRFIATHPAKEAEV